MSSGFVALKSEHSSPRIRRVRDRGRVLTASRSGGPARLLLVDQPLVQFGCFTVALREEAVVCGESALIYRITSTSSAGGITSLPVYSI